MGHLIQQKLNFLDEINLKVNKSKSFDCQGCENYVFHRPWESLNFIVFVILSKFLIPEFG